MTRDLPEVCDAPACWAKVETWCPLCEQFLCAPHDSRHACLGDQDDDDDRVADICSER